MADGRAPARTITLKHALVGLGVAVVVSVVASTAIAGQRFSDVNPSNPFYDDIEAIAAAGITTGFPDGTYRPGANVTRQAMAAFMGRGFSRVGYDEGGSFAVTFGAGTDLATVRVDAGATESGRGYVLLIGTVNVLGDSDQGDNVTVRARIVRDSDGAVGPSTVTQLVDTDGGTGAVSEAEESMTAMWAVPIDADDSETYSLEAAELGGGSDAFGGGRLSAIYVPFASSAESAPPIPS